MTNHSRPDYVYSSISGVKRNPNSCSYAVSNASFTHNHRIRQCRKPKVEQVGDYGFCRQHAKMVRRLARTETPSNSNVKQPAFIAMSQSIMEREGM